jgi:MHS family proline/betaine transporter-like MFS transporter
LAFLTGCFLGPIPAFLSESFCYEARYTGIALSNNLAMGIFGGTAPMVITYLISIFGLETIPLYYLMASAGVSLIGLMFMRTQKPRGEYHGSN